MPQHYHEYSVSPCERQIIWIHRGPKVLLAYVHLDNPAKVIYFEPCSHYRSESLQSCIFADNETIYIRYQVPSPNGGQFLLRHYTLEELKANEQKFCVFPSLQASYLEMPYDDFGSAYFYYCRAREFYLKDANTDCRLNIESHGFPIASVNTKIHFYFVIEICQDSFDKKPCYELHAYNKEKQQLSCIARFNEQDNKLSFRFNRNGTHCMIASTKEIFLYMLVDENLTLKHQLVLDHYIGIDLLKCSNISEMLLNKKASIATIIFKPSFHSPFILSINFETLKLKSELMSSSREHQPFASRSDVIHAFALAKGYCLVFKIQMKYKIYYYEFKALPSVAIDSIVEEAASAAAAGSEAGAGTAKACDHAQTRTLPRTISCSDKLSTLPPVSPKGRVKRSFSFSTIFDAFLSPANKASKPPEFTWE